MSLSLKGRFLPKPPMDQLGRYNNVRTVYPATTTKYIYIYTYIYQHHQEPRSPGAHLASAGIESVTYVIVLILAKPKLHLPFFSSSQFPPPYHHLLLLPVA
jgi:hypothetical protein